MTGESRFLLLVPENSHLLWFSQNSSKSYAMPGSCYSNVVFVLLAA